jgi:type VI secretion system secreted protein Hcp
MAFDAFLKLGDIVGESTDDRHLGWIEIESFSWGMTQSGSFSGGGGGGTGKVSFQDIHFTAHTQKSSPLIAKTCATGQHIPKAQLSFIKAQSDKGFEFVKFEFTDVLVSSYQLGGSSGGEDRPTDSFSLNFAKIEFDYIPQKADGSADSPVVFIFDVRENRVP